MISALETFAACEDDRARQAVVEQHPDLIGEETVAGLVNHVNSLLRVDLERAGRAAEGLAWLAERLDSRSARAFAHRARGNVRYYSRDYQGATGQYAAAISLFTELGDEKQAAITRSSAVPNDSQIGEIDRALELAARARESFLREGDDLRLARLENNIAYVHTRRDEFATALRHFEEGLGFLESAGDPSDVAITLRNIAVCQQMLHDFPAARAAYQRAREFSREHDLPLVAAEVDYNLAYLFYLRGEYTEANRRFERAREQSRRLGDREHEGLCDLDQSEIFLELNLIGEAERLAGRAVETFQELGMEYEAAKAMCSQALARFRRHDAEAALAQLDQSGRLFEQQGNRAWAAMTDLQRAHILHDKWRLEEATRLARGAHAVFLEFRLATKASLCEIFLARLAIASGRPGEARPLAAAALERLEEVGSPNHLARAWFVAGLAEERLGRRDAALAAFQRSDAALERLRGRLQTEELRIAFSTDKLALYEGLVELTLADEGDPERVRSALAWAEKGKSRALADLLATAGPVSSVVAGDVAEELNVLREELAWFDREMELEELKGQDRSPERIAGLRTESHRVEQSLLSLRRQLANRDPELSSLEQAATTDLEGVRSLLGDDEQLLEFFVARGSVYAFVVGAAGFDVERLADVKTVVRLRRELTLQIERFPLREQVLGGMSEMGTRLTQELLAHLYDELIRPLAPRLTASRLVVVPHGPLHGLPFQALHDGEGYLIDRFCLSYAPSATVLALCAARPEPTGTCSLVLGVPDDRAPLIREEATAVAESLPNATLRLGAEATRESLASRAVDCRYLHVATHGFHRRDNPIFSAIQLGDGRMSLFDLYNLRLDAELVVLSGCSTGLHSVQGGDELLGLSRGFLHAGARCLVVSLWDVNDESTTRLMRGFYRRRLAGAPIESALREAMLEVRETRPHPYFWAPFVLIGRSGGVEAA